MDTPSIILLVVSASISFGLGRLVVHFRNKKRREAKELADKQAAQALRDAPIGPLSKNKNKRRRQLELQEKRDKDGGAP